MEAIDQLQILATLSPRYTLFWGLGGHPELVSTRWRGEFLKTREWVVLICNQ